MFSIILVVKSISALFRRSKSATWSLKMSITLQMMYTRFYHRVAPPASATKTYLHVDQFYVDLAFRSYRASVSCGPGLNCMRFTTAGSFEGSLSINYVYLHLIT